MTVCSESDHKMQLAAQLSDAGSSKGSTALVLRSDMALATGSNTSTAITANELQLRHADMQQRRQDRKRHYHSQIWTKDFHGGPYRKASCTTGYDALTQHPDGRDKGVDPGYEQPQSGPTTNFVGNHMTQGAIDMVQMQLKHTRDLPLLLEARPCSGACLTEGSLPPPELLLSKDAAITGQVARAPNLTSMRKLLRSQRHKRNAAVAPPSATAERFLGTVTEDPPLPQSGSGDIQAAVNAGEACMRQGDYAAAAHEFTRALHSLAALHSSSKASDSSDKRIAAVNAATLLLQTAVCHREMGNCAAVIVDCTAALAQLPPEDTAAKALLLRASAHAEREQLTQGIDDCKAAVILQPNNERARKVLWQLRAMQRTRGD